MVGGYLLERDNLSKVPGPSCGSLFLSLLEFLHGSIELQAFLPLLRFLLRVVSVIELAPL